MMGCSYILGGFRWHYLYREYPIAVSIHGVIISIAANSIIPARGGELLRAFYLKQETDISIPETIARIIVERVLDAISIFSYLILTILLLGRYIGKNVNRILIIGVVLVICTILILFFYVVFSHRIDIFLKKLGRKFRVSEKIVNKGKDFLHTFKKLKMKRIILPLLFSFVITILGVMSLWFFLNACGINAELGDSILIFPLIALSISIPVTVGNICVYHGVMLGALSLIGFSGASLFTEVIFVHLLTILPSIFYGWILVVLKHLSYKQIYS